MSTLNPTTADPEQPGNFTDISAKEDSPKTKKSKWHLIDINRIFDSYATRKTMTAGFFNIALVIGTKQFFQIWIREILKISI